ncbi:hypothetical protein [Nitrospira sp. Ecomares 2.1]
MTAAITNITIGVNLIDDYLLTQEAPVSNALTRNLFAVVQNPASQDPISELLTIDGDGDPVHFYPDPTSQSGWATVKLGVTPPANTGICNRILGFYHQGTLNALCYYPLKTGAGSSAVWMQSSTPGTWEPASLSGTAKNWIGYTFQTDQYVDADGHAYLYGVTGNVTPHSFFVLTYATNPQTGTPQWMPIAERYPTQFTPEISDPDTAAFRLTEGPGGSGSVTVLWVDGSNISHEEATITWTQQTPTFTWTGQSGTFNPNKGALTAENLYAIPGPLGSGHLLLLDATSTLWLVANFYAAQPSITQLTGLASQPKSATAVGVGVDSSQTVTIFGIEPGNDYLWYLQQTGNGSLTFGSWVQLGGTLLTLNCPAYMRAGPELFSAGLATDPQSGASAPAVFHMDQNLPGGPQGNGDSPGTQVWSTRKVSAPPAPANTTPTQTATYSMELAGFDSGNNPVAAGTVTVTADQAVTVVWNSYAYHIGPTTPLTVELDESGQATVLYEAVGLTPPVITFTAVDASNHITGSRWCRGDVIQYIQALDGTPLAPLPDSVAPQLQTVTGTDLINQGLTGGDYQEAGPANTAAQAINSSGNWMNQNPTDSTGQGTIDLNQIKTPHWEIDFAHPEGPRFRVLTEEEARDLLRNRRATGQLGSSGSIFGDVAHFFKHEFDQLTYFAATVTDGVLNIVFNDLEPFVISTIKQAGAALETIFSKIRQLADEIYKVLQEVIAWLKMLFDWDDILNTHSVFKECMNQTLTNLSGSITYAQTVVQKNFAEVQAEVKEIFTNLESKFELIQGQSYNDFANSASESQNTLADPSTQSTQQQHASKCNYVYSRSTPSFTGASAISLRDLGGTLGDSDPTTVITDAVKQYIYSGNTSDQNTQQFNSTNATLQNFVTGKITNPSSLFDLIIVDLLTAAEDLVLFIMDGIEYVIEAILSVAASAIKAFSDLINQPIDIPIVTWLWKNVITKGDEFTLLDLVCLIFAVPATILYKLVASTLLNPNEAPQAPFSSSDVTTIQTTGLPWPTIPSEGVPTMAARTSDSSQLSAKIMASLTATSSFFMGLGYLMTMVSDYKAYQSQQEGAFVPSPKATFYSYLSLFFRSMTFATGAPGSVFAKPSSQWAIADRWTVGLWSTRGALVLADLVYCALSVYKTGAKWVPVYGPALKSAMGVLHIGIGAGASYYQLSDNNYSDWVPINNFLRPIPSCFKFLFYDPPESGVWAPIPWLLVIDAVAGVGATATQIGAAVYKFQNSN